MTRTPYHEATHELIGICGTVLFVGTRQQCYEVMLNIYGDARLYDLERQGARVRKI